MVDAKLAQAYGISPVDGTWDVRIPEERAVLRANIERLDTRGMDPGRGLTFITLLQAIKYIDELERRTR